MSRRGWSLKSIGLVAIAAGLLVAFSGGAAAKRPHPRCSLAGNKLAARLTFPCNRAVVTAGHNLTFRVFDSNPRSHRSHPYIELTERPPRRGKLPMDPLAGGFFGAMESVRGHRSQWIFTPARSTLPGWWDITPGKYYIQTQQVDDRAGVAGAFYSPVESIRVR